MGPKVIGVCGHIASGKSTVCKRTICELERSGMNCLYIEADKVAHECYAPGSELQDGLVEAFGKGIIDETGHVDRKALGAIVFDDESARLRLNDMVWPHIGKKIEKAIKETTAQVVFIDAALLVDAHWHMMCDDVWFVYCDIDTCIERCLQRTPGLSREAIVKRFETQLTFDTIKGRLQKDQKSFILIENKEDKLSLIIPELMKRVV